MERCFRFRGTSGVLERCRLAWPLVKILSAPPRNGLRDGDRFVEMVETESESETRAGLSGVGDRFPSGRTSSFVRRALASASC